jgi:cytochrome P450 family 4
MIAGFDTTGYTLASTLMLLAKHPNVQDKLRSEILATDDIDKRSKCNYMKDVITESNRLIPVSGLGAVRTTGRDFFCKNRSMMIPKGSDVKLCQTLHNRNPTVFTNPKAFEPERWENPTKEMQQSVMMFLCGLRRCPGQSLAMAELHSAIPKLIAEYQVDVESEGKILNFLTMGYVGARLNFTKISS